MAIPFNWLGCPRKSCIIAGKFIAFKTPLSDKYKNDVASEHRWTCDLLLKYIKDQHATMGLVIDLTNTKRYYDSDEEFKNKNILYEKLSCEGHTGPPNEEHIDRFIEICQNFIHANPDSLIGVHCTHGFNRTGFLICAYLCRQLNFGTQNAIKIFSTARPPGIYKQDYINKLVELYSGGSTVPMNAPQRPTWCLDERTVMSNISKKRSKDFDDKSMHKRCQKKVEKNQNNTFVIAHSDIEPLADLSKVDGIRLKCQQMCAWDRNTFPGSQPISMDHTNYQSIFLYPYMVSWKADGTRYMMLIEDKFETYMLDRNNNVFQVNNLCFPADSNFQQHLANTLVDGEFVIENDNGIQKYSYLIYDIIVLNDNYVGDKTFKERLDIIQCHIVGARNEVIAKGLIQKQVEPFSVDFKQFWSLNHVPELLGHQFQAQIKHGCDGLIFQPVLDPYQAGRSPHVFKWKENNTIDFRLRIMEQSQSKEKCAALLVSGSQEAYAFMQYIPELDSYDKQIIECSFNDGEWTFYRLRTDKAYPNSRETADGVMRSIKHAIIKKDLCESIENNICFID